MTVHEGRIVGLIGANGAGKTTLFDVISGFVAPAAGSITFRGMTELVALSPAERALAGLGRSFQNATLFESMTVAETLAVAFERRLRGIGIVANGLGLPRQRRAERVIRSRVEDLVDLMGLGAFHDKFISELSTGSRRIVDLACILAHEPKLLLLDEPSSGIAQREVEALGELLHRVKDSLGCTLLVVEHDIPMIRDLAHEIYVLEVGRVLSHGTPQEVLSDPEVVRSYLGTDAAVVERSGSRVDTAREDGDAVSDHPRNGVDHMSVKELRRLARELEVPGRSDMRRDDLLRAIRAVRGMDQEEDDGR